MYTIFLIIVAFILEIVLRTTATVVAAPFILLWPRKDKSEPYWTIARRRFGKVAQVAWA